MPNEELRKQNVNHALETTYMCFLKYGVEFVTREMISKQSGISRASLGRYWTDKTDCVIQTSEWLRRHIQDIFNEQFSPDLWKDKAGIEQLQGLMEWCRDLYRKDPRLFALYTEFKVYLHRSAPGLSESKKQLIRALGFRPLVAEIYGRGIRDGSISIRFDVCDEVAFFGDAFFGYLSNLAFQPEIDIDNAIRDIDRYIERMISIYNNLK